MLCASADDYGYSFGILRVAYVDQLVLSDLRLFDELSIAKGFFGQVFDACNDPGAGGFGELLQISTADILDCGYSILCEKVQSHIVYPLLREENVRAGLLYLGDHVLEHFLLFLDEEVHLVWIVDIDLRVKLRLLDLKLGVEQRYPRSITFLRHLGVRNFLVYHNPFDKLCLLQAAAVLLYDLDQINVGLDFAVYLLGYLLDCLDRDVGEVFLRDHYAFAVHRGHGYLSKGCVILVGDRYR